MKDAQTLNIGSDKDRWDPRFRVGKLYNDRYDKPSLLEVLAKWEAIANEARLRTLPNSKACPLLTVPAELKLRVLSYFRIDMCCSHEIPFLPLFHQTSSARPLTYQISQVCFLLL